MSKKCVKTQKKGKKSVKKCIFQASGKRGVLEGLLESIRKLSSTKKQYGHCNDQSRNIWDMIPCTQDRMVLILRVEKTGLQQNFIYFNKDSQMALENNGFIAVNSVCA